MQLITDCLLNVDQTSTATMQSLREQLDQVARVIKVQTCCNNNSNIIRIIIINIINNDSGNIISNSIRNAKNSPPLPPSLPLPRFPLSTSSDFYCCYYLQFASLTELHQPSLARILNTVDLDDITHQWIKTEMAGKGWWVCLHFFVLPSSLTLTPLFPSAFPLSTSLSHRHFSSLFVFFPFSIGADVTLVKFYHQTVSTKKKKQKNLSEKVLPKVLIDKKNHYITIHNNHPHALARSLPHLLFFCCCARVTVHSI